MNTSAGADARIGVAIVIGSVRSAQNVKIHEVATMTDFAAASARVTLSAARAAPSLPLTAVPSAFAACLVLKSKIPSKSSGSNSASASSLHRTAAAYVMLGTAASRKTFLIPSSS